MLKVHVDQGGDYLDYLKPFIHQVLADERPDPVTDAVVESRLQARFGLMIPARTVQIVLKRLSRVHPLDREFGVYRITGEIRDPGIGDEAATASARIDEVVTGLLEFSARSPMPLASKESAVVAICGFLEQFNIPCLRAYLRGTAIPDIGTRHESDVILVSQYVLEIQSTSPRRFDDFMVMAQGHMLANALLCPDLQNAPKSYRGTTFYFDTPLLVRLLGLEGELRQAAVENVLELLQRLGGSSAAFAHSREELDNVIRGAAENVESQSGRGAIVHEARRRGATRSDLVLLAGQVDERLEAAGVAVKKTPPYVEGLQIDQSAFERVLDDEVSYFNPRAREYDINSVRSIYVLRRGFMPTTVERCKAVFVTSNAAFAHAAWEYGKQQEASREVSPVITDFGLANMAWLKAPMGAPSVPTTEVLAFAYAGLQPSKELLTKYLAEVDRLEKQGSISERDHQILRSSAFAHEPLMRLTLGDDAALSEETISETLRRVTTELKREESERLAAEQVAHQRTRDELGALRTEKMRAQEALYWRCHRRAKWCGHIIGGVAGLVLVVGLVGGIGMTSTNPVVGWGLAGGSGLALLMSMANVWMGTTVRGIRSSVVERCRGWLIRREAVATGLELKEP